MEALRDAGAVVTVHDPLYSDEELLGLGLPPHRRGATVDVAILQADHPEYRSLGAEDLPGVKVVLDGRHILKASSFPKAKFLVIGNA